MESLSSACSDSYWSVEQHELVPTKTASTIPRTKVKSSNYDTGFSVAEYEKHMKQAKKAVGRVRKVRL